MPTTLTNGIQLPDKGSVDWYSSMQSNYNLIDTHLGDTDVHVTAEDKANWNSKQGSLSQDQLDAIAQVATNTDDIATLQSGKADASHTHSSSDITDIDDYATKDYVDNSISGLVDNAPDALNTLNELSAALNDDSNFASTVTTALASKADSADLATVATSGSYNDLDDLPTIPTNTSDLTNDSDFVVSSNLATVATSGDYDDLSNKPSIPTKTSDLTNDSNFVDSSSLAAVATSGDYDDLDNKPSIPTNTSDLNNDSGFVTLNDFDIPSKTSDLTNDSGFITSSDVPTSTSDLTNDSNFVDTSNPAVASGITSAKVTDYDAHIADTDIHVTTADKNRWNNQTYVFRYSSTALVASSTNSNALLDNTDNLKVGDKVIDSSGVIFSITAIDTQNSTFTIGTALIDLAQDSDVVHKSGDETISGVKSLINYFLGKDLSGQTVNLNDCVDAYGGAIHYYYAVSNYTNISNKPENKPFILESKTVRYVSSIDYIYYQKIYTADYNVTPSIYTRYYRSGSASWSNWIKDTDKFVTTDTAQTISGQKVFDDINTISSSSEIGVSGGNNSFKVLDKNKKTISRLEGGTYSTGMAYSTWLVNNGTDVFNGVSLYQPSANLVQLRPVSSALSLQLGSLSTPFSDCYTSKINGVEPSSLSLPATTGTIDISSYITDLTGVINSYTPLANGYIVISCNSNDVDYIKMSNNLNFVSVVDNTNNQFTNGILGVWQPCVAGIGIQIRIKASALNSARFIPCQGNV